MRVLVAEDEQLLADNIAAGTRKVPPLRRRLALTFALVAVAGYLALRSSQRFAFHERALWAKSGQRSAIIDR
jgi:hypothetical protein